MNILRGKTRLNRLLLMLFYRSTTSFPGFLYSPPWGGGGGQEVNPGNKVAKSSAQLSFE